MLNFSLTSYFASVLQICVASEMNPLSCNHRENCLKQDAVPMVFHCRSNLCFSFSHAIACISWNCFLNQARAGHRPARAWFLKIDPVRTSVCVFVCVFVCVCPRPRGY